MFVHQSLPDIGVKHISLDTKIGELFFKFANFYQCHDWWRWRKNFTNKSGFSKVAKESGMAIAVGSQMSAIKNAEEDRYLPNS